MVLPLMPIGRLGGDFVSEKVCVVCGKEFDAKLRKYKDTCSDECAFTKVRAWAWYLREYKHEIMAEAIKKFKKVVEEGV